MKYNISLNLDHTTKLRYMGMFLNDKNIKMGWSLDNKSNAKMLKHFPLIQARYLRKITISLFSKAPSIERKIHILPAT